MEKDPNDNWTYNHYDPFGRLKFTELPDGGETTVDYYDHVFPRYVRTKVKEDDSGSTIDAYLDEGDVWASKRRQVVTVVADTSRLIDEAVARASNQEWNTALDRWQHMMGPYFPVH